MSSDRTHFSTSTCTLGRDDSCPCAWDSVHLWQPGLQDLPRKSKARGTCPGAGIPAGLRLTLFTAKTEGWRGRWSSKASVSSSCPLSTVGIGLATGSDLSLSTGDDVISGPSLKGRVHCSPGGPSLSSPTCAAEARFGSKNMIGTCCAA